MSIVSYFLANLPTIDLNTKYLSQNFCNFAGEMCLLSMRIGIHKILHLLLLIVLKFVYFTLGSEFYRIFVGE